MSRKFLSLLAAFAVVVSAGVASASVQFNLNHSFSPAGTTGTPTGSVSDDSVTLVDVQIYDIGDLNNPNPGDNLVLGPGFYNLSNDEALIVVTGHLAPETSLAKLVLNFNPSKTGALSISYLGSSGVSAVDDTPGAGPINYDPQFEVVDSNSRWDIGISFQGPNKFDGTDYAVFKATYVGGILATDFEFKNTAYTGPNGQYYAAAQIDSTPLANPGFMGAAGSNPLGADGDPPFVPEPASLAIWGLGLGIAGLVRLRRKK